jgi:hypothetical protein
MHGTCPSCRHLFLDIQVPDDESSDGGEYVPGDHEVDDDDMELDPTEPEDELDEEALEVDIMDEPGNYASSRSLELPGSLPIGGPSSPYYAHAQTSSQERGLTPGSDISPVCGQGSTE